MPSIGLQRAQMAAHSEMTGESILPGYRDNRLIGFSIAGASTRPQEMG